MSVSPASPTSQTPAVAQYHHQQTRKRYYRSQHPLHQPTTASRSTYPGQFHSEKIDTKHFSNQSVAMSRKSGHWFRSILGHQETATDQPSSNMSAKVNISNRHVQDDFIQKQTSEPAQKASKTLATPISSTRAQDGPIFGNANNPSSPFFGFGPGRGSVTSRDEWDQSERIRATAESQEAHAMLLKAGIKTEDFQIRVDKKAREERSINEQRERFNEQRELAEIFKQNLKRRD